MYLKRHAQSNHRLNRRQRKTRKYRARHGGSPIPYVSEPEERTRKGDARVWDRIYNHPLNPDFRTGESSRTRQTKRTKKDRSALLALRRDLSTLEATSTPPPSPPRRALCQPESSPDIPSPLSPLSPPLTLPRPPASSPQASSTPPLPTRALCSAPWRSDHQSSNILQQAAALALAANHTPRWQQELDAAQLTELLSSRSSSPITAERNGNSGGHKSRKHKSRKHKSRKHNKR